MYIQTIYDGDTIKYQRVISNGTMVGMIAQLYFERETDDTIELKHHMRPHPHWRDGVSDGYEAMRGGLRYTFIEVSEDDDFFAHDGFEIIINGEKVV